MPDTPSARLRELAFRVVWFETDEPDRTFIQIDAHELTTLAQEVADIEAKRDTLAARLDAVKARAAEDAIHHTAVGERDPRAFPYRSATEARLINFERAAFAALAEGEA